MNRAYPTMKKHNPHTPIMMREAAGTEPQVFARYGTTIATSIEVNGWSNVTNVLELCVQTSERRSKKHYPVSYAQTSAINAQSLIKTQASPTHRLKTGSPAWSSSRHNDIRNTQYTYFMFLRVSTLYL